MTDIKIIRLTLPFYVFCQVCPAGDNCENQCFTKRLYAETEVVKTADRGWGLKANQPVKKVCIDMNAAWVTVRTNEL